MMTGFVFTSHACPASHTFFEQFSELLLSYTQTFQKYTVQWSVEDQSAHKEQPDYSKNRSPIWIFEHK